MTAATRAMIPGPEEDKMKHARTVEWVRRRGPALTLDLAVNVFAPLLIYHALQHRSGELTALFASTLPPLAWSVGTFLHSRRVDAISVLAIAGIALSLLAFFGGGSVQLLQLREKTVTLLIALAFLGSAAVGKPLIYPLARASMARKSAGEAAAFEARRHNAAVRHTVMMMTLAWGFGLLADFAVSVLLIYTVSISTYLVLGPIIGYGTIGGLSVWTMLYRRQRTGQPSTMETGLCRSSSD